MSKPEVMFIPSIESSSRTNNLDSFYVDEENTKFVSFCKSFKYLGTAINDLMEDTEDV